MQGCSLTLPHPREKKIMIQSSSTASRHRDCHRPSGMRALPLSLLFVLSLAHQGGNGAHPGKACPLFAPCLPACLPACQPSTSPSFLSGSRFNTSTDTDTERHTHPSTKRHAKMSMHSAGPDSKKLSLANLFHQSLSPWTAQGSRPSEQG